MDCFHHLLCFIIFVNAIVSVQAVNQKVKYDPRTYQLNTTMETKSIGAVSYKHRIMTSTHIDLMFYVTEKAYLYWTNTVERDGKLINCSLDSEAECFCQMWRDHENVYIEKGSNNRYFHILMKLNTCGQHFDLSGIFNLYSKKLGQMPTSINRIVDAEVHVLSSEKPARIANEGTPVVLNCIAHGFPHVMYFHWTKSSDGKIWTEIDKKRAVHTTNSVRNDTLTLTSFNNAVDEGYYKCNATQLWDSISEVYSHDIDVFYVSPSEPNKPYNLQLLDIQSNAMKVQWQQPSPPNNVVTRYHVERKMKNIPNDRATFVVKHGSSIKLDGLDECSKYCVTVWGENAAGNGTSTSKCTKTSASSGEKCIDIYTQQFQKENMALMRRQVEALEQIAKFKDVFIKLNSNVHNLKLKGVPDN